MASIGEYIHYSFENYKRFGLLKKRQEAYRSSGTVFNTGSSYGGEVFNTQKSNMLQELRDYGGDKQAVAKLLENELNRFYGQDFTHNGQIVPGMTPEDRKRLEDAIYKQVEQIVNQTVIRSQSSNLAGIGGGTFNGQRVTKGKSHALSSIRRSKKYRSSTGEDAQANPTAIAREAKRLLYIWKVNSVKLTAQPMTNVAALQQTMNDLQREVHNLNKEIKKGTAKRISKTDNIYQLLQQANDAYNYATSAEINGLLGELAPAVILHALQHGVDSAVNDVANIFQKQVKGSRTTNSVLNCKFITKNVDVNKVTEGSSYTIPVQNQYGDIIALSSTAGNIIKQKIDIEGTFQDKKIEGLSEINYSASAKNYNSTYGRPVELVKSSSLLTLVQQYDTFVNHYLNVVPTHEEGGEDTNLKLLAKEAMKFTIFRQALVGERSFSNGGQVGLTKGADLFIYHDNSVGRFYVYSMGGLISRAMALQDAVEIKGLESQDNYINSFVGDKEQRNLGDAYTRITNILKQMMATKIGVSMDFNKVIGT